ncbi:type II toxin-antitoxin system HicA family toxin [Calidifontibacter sp. DB0510]|uniref:Type II toxin-antitoxin system HicA family toxin n=1 Tax=Metallococcus carri TaxID=1656884 RepID=A0A967E9M6_9MICO|nr:type II toxin-antitoxin system HicA family toxin [Metallococcus carri]NOP38851.1 type II toxin-antitoxin system HicA family toxin [Calidifontibacter sp. DB2511S]
MEQRRFATLLRRAGCTSRRGFGDLEVWTCPCEEHRAVVPDAGTISRGVIADTVRKLSCLPLGWWR